MIRNERGLTLVEVLATITIISIAGVIIWQVFFQGYQYSQKAISKNMMVQEANIITTSLLKIHQTSNQYELRSSDSSCGIRVEYDGLIKEFNPLQICVTFELNSSITGVVQMEGFNMPDVPLKLTLSDRTNPNNKVTVETTLYRMGRDTADGSPK